MTSLRIASLSLGLLVIATGMQAANVTNGDFVGLANFSGSRSTPYNVAPGGLVGTATKGWEEEFTLDWQITYNIPTQLYTYKYTLDWLNSENGAVSHFTLQLSPDCIQSSPTSGGASLAAGCVSDVLIKSGDQTINSYTLEVGNSLNANSEGTGNASVGTIQGIKFDDISPGDDILTIQFNSTRRPVWGDFNVKDGQNLGAVWNKNIGIASGDQLYYIARPDTVEGPPPPPQEVPEPGTYAMLAGGLGLLAFARRRMK